MAEKPKRPQITITLDGPLPREEGEAYPPFSVEAQHFPTMPPEELVAEINIILTVLLAAQIKRGLTPGSPSSAGLIQLIELVAGVWEGVGETTTIEGIDLDDLRTPKVRA